jgi:pimeloyl-ACP methyl ester carboxylesterase
MRLLEVLFLIVALIGLLSFVPRASMRGWRRLAPFVPIAAAMQILVEGARWQLVPGYGLAMGVALAYLCGRLIRCPRWVTTCMVVSGLFVLGVSSILATVFPVFSFPIPDGPFGVGTFVVQWKDDSRSDVFSQNANDRRVLVAQIYYPAESGATGRRAMYLTNADRVSVQLMAVLGFPTFLVSHLRYVETNAVENAWPATAAGRMPVLIFLSGADGFRNSNYAQVQALVSHGYIIVCLDQPGTAASTRLDDGRNLDAIPRTLMQRLIDQSINPGFPSPRMNGRSFPEGFISYLAQDAVFTRQQLTELNRHGLLAGRLDLQQVGLFGISLGGIEVPEACLADPGIRACMVMESPMTKRVLTKSLGQPTMFITRLAVDMRDEGWPQPEVDRHLSGMGQVFTNLRGDGFFLQITGAFHANFGDTTFWSPLVAKLGLTGPIDGARCEAIIEAYQLAFFDNYLRGSNSLLLTSSSTRFPEVVFQARH